MTNCFSCGKELTDKMKYGGYSSIFKCECGAMNSVKEQYGTGRRV